MKTLRIRALALALTLAMVLGLSGAALAAEADPAAPESAISVQLDGEDLTFTDAVPQVKDQRTFLPFRAVFEAMGAQVSNEGNVITAVRDGKTLTMTIGSTEASVSEGGAVTPITMDVAPYVDSSTWRTYVPVRFAAQAFGCAVGWDQEAQTAVIVDVESVVKDALDTYHFTYLDKYMEYAQQFQQGNWAVSGKLEGSLTMMQIAPMTVSATYEGISAQGTAVEMAMNMTMDMEQFLAGVAEQTGGSLDDLTAEDKAMLEDMNALTEDSGMDWATLMASMEQMSDLDLYTLLNLLMAQVPVDDSATAYADVKNAAELVAKLLADESFVKNGNNYTTTFSYEESGAAINLALTFTMDKDAVVGYKLEGGLSVDAGDMGQIGLQLTEALDKDNHLTASFTVDLGIFMNMEMTMTGDYTATGKAPVTTPPEGANVIDFVELLTQAGAVEEPAPETAA